MILIIDNYDSFTYNLVHLVAENLERLGGIPSGHGRNKPSEHDHGGLSGAPSGAPSDGPSDNWSGAPNSSLRGGRGNSGGGSGSSGNSGGGNGGNGSGSFRTHLIVRRNDQITMDEIRDLSPDGILISPGPGRPEDAGVSQQVVATSTGEWPVLGVCLGHQIIGECFGGTVGYARSLMHGKTSEIQHDGKSIFESVEQRFIATRYHSLVVDRSSVPDDLEITAETDDQVVMGLRHKSLPIEGIQFHPESILTVEGPKIISNWVESCFTATTHVAETK